MTNPAKPGRIAVVRLDQDVTEAEIGTHLANLGIEEADFLAWHERIVALLRR